MTTQITEAAEAAPSDPAADPRTRGATVWLTGLPSAGKSTVAAVLAGELRAAGHRVESLDGDEVRTHLSAGLGFSRADRDTHVRRIGWIASVLARNGVKVVVPVIAPYAATRDEVRAAHEGQGIPFVEVHVATSLATCVARDVKGLYAKQAAGEIDHLTGVDDPYEAPEHPEVRLITEGRTVTESASEVLASLVAGGLA